MKLYMIPECPFVHRVLLGCHVRGIGEKQIELKKIDLGSPPPSMLDINPSGSVPTLEFSDGGGFHESLVILEFLDTLAAPGPKIFGADPRATAKIKVLWETVNSLLLQPVQQAIYSFGNANTLRSAQLKMQTAWMWLDKTLPASGEEFFGGSELNAIDIALAPFLARLPYVSEFHPAIKLPDPKSRSGAYFLKLRTFCMQSRIFPDESVMRETTLKFARPHKMISHVQSASRTPVDNAEASVAAAGSELSAWSVAHDGNGFCLNAKFSFESHADAVRKLNWLHETQETCDHHTSFLMRDFAEIEISLVTHEPCWGVTEKDLSMAKLLQAYFEKGQLP